MSIVILLQGQSIINDVIINSLTHFFHPQRNVLVTNREVVKLADFGLSRGLHDGNYYVG